MQEPIRPIEPTKNEVAKFELIKAMGVAIAAIAKEKAVAIASAVVEENDGYYEMVIKCNVPSDKNEWEVYEAAKRKYADDHKKWVDAEDCKKFGITEKERANAEEAYNKFRRENGYPYPEIKRKEDFYQEISNAKKISPVQVV